MKFLLTIVMCSSVAGSCLTPHTFETFYKDSYDCLMDGYQKSIDKMSEVGRSEINQYGIYLKFDCQPLILPEKKPTKKTAPLPPYTI
jgi:hypothetical protein